MPDTLLTDEIDDPTKKICINCGVLIDLNGKFCKSCGTRQSAQQFVPIDDKWRLLQQAAIFYALNVVVCLLTSFVDYFQTLPWLLFFEIALAAFAICFFALNWSENKRLLIWRNFSWQKLAAYIAIAIIGSFIVHYTAGWLNTTIFPKREQYYTYLRGNLFAELFLVFFMAVTPALFEELAFRGYLLQTLLKVADTEQAVYISAFLFAIIHLSFISVFWLIPFALFLGFTRIKENTLWYGVFFHFFFNLTACMLML